MLYTSLFQLPHLPLPLANADHVRAFLFQTEEHGGLAHAIDAFYSVVSDDWVDAYEELFRFARPPVVEQAREETVQPRRVGFDPAAAWPHTLGTGASSAAGEPHPQTHTALGGVQEEAENDDNDIEMGEGEEVGEVRERLARTAIGRGGRGRRNGGFGRGGGRRGSLPCWLSFLPFFFVQIWKRKKN